MKLLSWWNRFFLNSTSQIDQFNKSTNEKYLYMKFLGWWNRFSFNSTSQQQNDTPQHLEMLGRKVQFNKSTANKTLYMKFLRWWNRFFLNSTSQQQNDIPPQLDVLSRIAQFNKSTNKKIPLFEIFELVNKVSSQFNKSTTKWHTPTFRNLRQESLIQQVKGRKHTHVGNFELVENGFLNSTSQQQNNTAPFSKVLSTKDQFNKSMAKKHLYMKFLDSRNGFFFSIQQVNSNMTYPS